MQCIRITLICEVNQTHRQVVERGLDRLRIDRRLVREVGGLLKRKFSLNLQVIDRREWSPARHRNQTAARPTDARDCARTRNVKPRAGRSRDPGNGEPIQLRHRKSIRIESVGSVPDVVDAVRRVGDSHQLSPIAKRVRNSFAPGIVQ